MKVLRGTLTFILGMVIGIVLLVVAIGGTVFALATTTTVGKLQESFGGGTEFISKDSAIYDKTVLDAVKVVTEDVKDIDKLSLETLYQHYGIKVLNGISGIDFTDKDFYKLPIKEVIDDLSKVVNSFTLTDISKIAGVDFGKYNIPVLSDNLDKSLKDALDAVMGSISGNMTLRSIKDNFGIDIGLDSNDLLKNLQDMTVSQFGNAVGVLPVSLLMHVDADLFIPADKPGNLVYYKEVAEENRMQEVSAEDLANPNYAVPIGVEYYLAGTKTVDEKTVADYKELRYEQKTVTNEDGTTSVTYVVNNSCYAEDFNAQENTKTFYRCRRYEEKNGVLENLTDIQKQSTFKLCYANKVASVNGENYTLATAGFYSYADLADIEKTDVVYGIPETVTTDSALEEVDLSFTGAKYYRVKAGTSAAILQKIAYMTVNELQNADNLFNNLKVSEVITEDENTAKIMKTLIARDAYVKDLGSIAGKLTLGEMIDIVSDNFTVDNLNGIYVRIENEGVYTLYDENNPTMAGLQRYALKKDGTYEENARGKFVKSYYYRLYNLAKDGAEATKYSRAAAVGSSSAILQRFSGATLDDFSTMFSSLIISDVMQIDADIYEAVSKDDALANPTDRYFVYDDEINIYRLVKAENIATTDKLLYRVAKSGSDKSIIKKLAFVKIDDLSKAMDMIIQDTMLSEFLDIYNENAVVLESVKATDGNYAETDKFFAEWTAGNKYCFEKDGVKYIYLLDANGAYVNANIRPVKLTTVESRSISFSYASIGSFDAGDRASTYANAITIGNLYYKDTDGVYHQNAAVCSALYAKALKALAESETAATAGNTTLAASKVADYEKYCGLIYIRTSGSDFSLNTPLIKTTCAEHTLIDNVGLYVRDPFYGFVRLPAYSVSDPALAGYYQLNLNPVFAGMEVYTFEVAASGTPYFIDRSDATLFSDDTFKTRVLTPAGLTYSSDGLFYSAVQCVDVYVRNDVSGGYVFDGGVYKAYSETFAGQNRYDKKQGVVDETGAFFTDNGDSSPKYELLYDGDVYKIASFDREESVPVLKTLASGTISDMNKIISDAKIADVMEVPSGSLFDNETIRNSTITNLGNAFNSLLNTMKIGDLIKYSGVKTINATVANILNDVSITDFFGSLEFDTTTATMTVNILKLYGIEE